MPPATGKPAWLRYAVPAPPAGNRPLVAIVLDNLGLDRVRTAEAIRLSGPLTLSFMTYASDLVVQTQTARHAGHELLVQVPMEALDRYADPGPLGLFTALSRDEILERLRWGLGRFDGFVGINNHMGSKFTSDERGMEPVMDELHARGLLFLDSCTSPFSAGVRLAIAFGVAHAARDVFLDDDPTPRQSQNSSRWSNISRGSRQRDRHRSPARRNDRHPQELASDARREAARSGSAQHGCEAPYDRVRRGETLMVAQPADYLLLFICALSRHPGFMPSPA